ncbi:TlpA family protein disulfide reductase [candidate division KSB1 bacterium]|nr:TlpA family protein disulfide reductase [candidate division KSB1 bacterium]
MIKISVIIILGFASFSFSQEADTSTVVQLGQVAPNFTVQTLDGETIQISDLKGKVVLLNFFATWCGPCNEELPELEKTIWPKFRDKDYVQLSIGREHTKEELLKFRKGKELTIPMASDPERKIYSMFAKIYIPRNVVIGKDGKIAYLEMGFDEEKGAALIQAIEDQLKL